MKHNYRNKFDLELLNGKIVMAFTDPLDILMENVSVLGHMPQMILKFLKNIGIYRRKL